MRRLSFSLEYSAGYDNTILCPDSRQALDLMERHSIGLVILDLTMPHIRGDALLDNLKADYPDVPVIMLSGLNQVATAVECIKKGRLRLFRQD